MEIKIKTSQQVSDLRVGNILKRIQLGSMPGAARGLDKGVDTFEIRSINAVNEMIGLVATGDEIVLYGSPWAIGRLFIKSYKLQEEDIWWICI